MKQTIKFMLLFVMLIPALHVVAENESLQQSTRTITGVVVDEDNEPVTGASILIPGTATGTISDLDGNFRLDYPADRSTLQVSYVGYQVQTVSIAGRTNVTIKLQVDSQGLDEIVVIGYGVVKKRDLTGSVASVRSGDIVSSPTSNAMEAIQGKAAGIDIVRSSGEAGATPEINIRGNRSINGSNRPLFIIDGVQGGNYEDLNPNDIETMDIFKDASSTAIYGSQGANGVVIITTKKGQEGKVRTSYDGYFGVNKDVQYPEPLTGEAFMNYRREAYRTIGAWNSPADDVNAFTSDELQAIQNNKWVNWLDLVTRTASHQSHNVSVRGGSENTKAFMSLGYYSEEGVLLDNSADRYTARLNIDQKMSKYVKSGLYSQLTYWDRNHINNAVLQKASSAFPLATPYDEFGEIVLYPMVGRASAYSPLADYQKNKGQRNNKRLNTLTTAYVEVTPMKGLTFRSNASASLGFQKTSSYYGQNSLVRESNLGSASINNANTSFLSWDNVLSYKTSFNKLHNVGLTAITSWTQSIREDNSASNLGQTTDAFLWHSLQSGSAGNNTISSGYEENKRMSYAFRGEYAFADKYLFSGSLRRDGASQLAEGNKWHIFPSVSGAWVMSQESFMEDVDWVDFLKLRASWGIAGNAAVDPYATQIGVRPGNPWGFNNISAPTLSFSSVVGNSGLGWEKSETYNLGLDYHMLNGRIALSFDYYNTQTSDIMLQRNMPTAIYGEGARMWQNIASTENKGIEITLNTVNVKTRDFQWQSTLTFSKDNEKITSLIDGRDIIGQGDRDHALLIGRPIKSWWDLKKIGLWQLGEEDQMAAISYYGMNPQPGDIKIQNTDGDDKIDDGDETYLGSESPKWIGGFKNTFTYKGFDLSVYMFARWGQTIAAQYAYAYNPAGAISSGNGMQQANTFATFDYWTPENPTNDYPRPAAGTILPTTGRSLYFIDGSFFKIKTLTLGYTVPKTVTNKLKVDNLRVYGTANNLLTHANSHLMKNYDPEGNGGDRMPLFKTFVAGVSITF